jgi:RNA polymerase sigma-70 factor (family 1)
LTDRAFYDEEAVLAKFAEGDMVSFDALYNRYYEPIRLNILKIVRDETITDDLLQEVFILFWKKRALFAGKNKANGWLFVVSYNCSINFLRRLATEKLYLKSISFAEQLSGDEDLIHIQEMQFQLLEQAIAHLPPQQKRVFELCRLEGKSYHETAIQLEISKNTVKGHLARATESVRCYVDSHSGTMKLATSVIMVLLMEKNSF